MAAPVAHLHRRYAIAIVIVPFGAQKGKYGEADASCLAPLNDELRQIIGLDAEDLAEGGIGRAYAQVIRQLRKHVALPAEIQEFNDPDVPRYSVMCEGVNYRIYSPELNDQGHSWGRAAHALFTIVNDQLQQSDVKFYAINGGNDLVGIFLRQSEVDHAQQTLPRNHWPYLPTLDHPWYGQPHE